MAARDVLVISMIVFFLAIGFFTINYVMTTMVGEMTTTSEINVSASAVEALEGISSLMARLDYIVLGVMIGSIIALIITSWFIAGNPMFVFIYLIVIVIGVIMGAVLSNVWEAFTMSGQFGTTITSFPISNHVIGFLPYYVAVMGVIGLVVMFAKPAFSRE